MDDILRGRELPAETRRKMSEAHAGYGRDPEVRPKRSKAQSWRFMHPEERGKSEPGPSYGVGIGQTKKRPRRGARSTPSRRR